MSNTALAGVYGCLLGVVFGAAVGYVVAQRMALAIITRIAEEQRKDQ